VTAEKRPCPSCGREISARAKQCKHCFEFVTPAAEAIVVPPPPRPLLENNQRLATPPLTVALATDTARYRYRVVSFMGTVQTGVFSKQDAQSVSHQLQNVIDEQAIQGWDYYSIEKVNIEVRPGCIGGLLGQSASYITSDQIVFRQDASAR
jgi:hypothetical protein